MKYCQKCGSEISMDDAVVCPNCGCSIAPEKKDQRNGSDGLAIAAKIFLILACVSSGWLLLPLAWTLPITITICGRMKRNEPVGTGLKVCALLFVNVIAGILLLCRSDEG